MFVIEEPEVPCQEQKGSYCVVTKNKIRNFDRNWIGVLHNPTEFNMQLFVP